jgi:sarcosine oxidase gamma subunit
MNAADAVVMPTPVTALPLAPCFEFVAYPGREITTAASGAWPGRAGQVLRDAAGRATLLHFAPDRWLAPAPEPTVMLQLASLERAGCGTLIDVAGKWQELRFMGQYAPRLLARGIDVETALADRDCAALSLFDCPAIVACHAAAFNVWVAPSFARSFLEVTAAMPDLQPSS